MFSQVIPVPDLDCLPLPPGPAVVVCEPGLAVVVLVCYPGPVAVIQIEDYAVGLDARVYVLEGPRGTVVRGVPEVSARVVVVRYPAQVAAVYGDGGPAADVVGAVDHLPRPPRAAPRGELQVVRRLVPVCYPGVVAAVQCYRVVPAVVVRVVYREVLVDPVGAVVVGVAESVVLVVVVGDVGVPAAVQVQGCVQCGAVLVHDRLQGLHGPGCPVVVGILQPGVVIATCIPVPV